VCNVTHDFSVNDDSRVAPAAKLLLAAAGYVALF
jgi:hypothetical protein